MASCTPQARHPRRLAGDPADLVDADAPLAGPAEALAGELEQDARGKRGAVDRGRGRSIGESLGCSDGERDRGAAVRNETQAPSESRGLGQAGISAGTASAIASSPTMNRANGRPMMFSPVRAFRPWMISRIVLASSLTNGWSSRTPFSPNQASSLPSTIFSRMFSGLFGGLGEEDPLLLGDEFGRDVLAAA